ncbi:FtsK/SpoIIIE domain-containing protein [Georgenia alba]|uniref:FtsK/SpoIIIE domain-containing protein n=1 Tax=Georgenia alba TaxID=2233858 RepID=A0ABW2Q5Z0_9MICO
MKVKLTLLRDGVPPADIVVRADSTATAADVARYIAAGDPARTVKARPEDVLTLAVAPPTAERLEPLPPDVPIGEAPIGSGFAAAVHNLGPQSAEPAAVGSRDVVGVLRAVEGPLRGQEFPLTKGHASIGRDPRNDIVLADPMVSKRHARIEVSGPVELVDLNSANGVLVDGVPVQRVRLMPGEPLVIGGTTLVMYLAPTQEETTQAEPVLERGGGLLFNRSPRVEVRYPGTRFPAPRMPTEKLGNLFPWTVLLAPIFMGVVLYLMTERPRVLLMVIMTPLMMLGNFVNQSRQASNKQNHAAVLFERQYEELEEKFYRGKPEEERARNEEVPPVAEVFEHAMRLGPMLWTRRPEHWNFLAVRFGTCRDESRNSILEQDQPDGLPEYIDRMERLAERYKFVDDVPVLESLPAVGSVGVAGPTGPASDAIRGLAVQVFGLHAPNEVVAVAFADGEWVPELEWIKWLPHTSSETSPFRDLPLADSEPTANALLANLEEYVLSRTDKPERRGPFDEEWNPMLYGSDVNRASEGLSIKGPISVIVLVTSNAPVDRARLTQVLERGADIGVHALFVSPTIESLPAVCRSFLDVTPGLEDANAGLVRNGELIEHVKVEGVSGAYMDSFAKRLAPVVDASTVVHDASDIPSAVGFVSLVGYEVADDPDAVVERWRQNNTIIDRSDAPRPRRKSAGNLRAIVGQGVSDAMTLDLRSQGPHALVGGTTGAGKSEFLQAWVLGIASAHSPDRVTFLFVDYKGGSAFADCVDLPHCVGLVTDLSPHLVRRALTSLRAELHHREHLLNRKKAKDLLELERRQDPETPPALILVIDEFAALATEVPEFVDGVVDIGQRGRSLGIHLIMATQRPAGVIKDNLRANTNLRVALRMADTQDSEDVVGEPVAATFPPTLPGRAVAKTGPGRLVHFQSAYAGGWTRRDEVDEVDVKVAELRFGSTTEWEPERAPESDTVDDLGPNDQKRIVDTLVRAADVADLPVPRRPWLDELGDVIELRDLPGEGDTRIVLGMADLPERQRQDPVHYAPDRDGSLAVFGMSGSGKSSVLKTIATAAGMQPEIGTAVVYGLDFASGALGVLERLPHVGSIVDSDDPERIQRLLLTIRRELDRRSTLFAKASAASLTEYRKLADPTMPRILLLVDNFVDFRKEWEYTSVRMPYYRGGFMRVLGEGRPLGVHAVITADRGGSVPPAVLSNISRRLVLRLSDPNQYVVVGAPKDVLDEESAPGRALVDKNEVQIAILGGTTNVADQSKALRTLASELRAVGVPEAPEIGSLPTRLDVTELPDRVDDLPVIGMADETLAPRGFDPVGSFVVTGPAQSGKTNTLRVLVTALERFDPGVRLFHFGSRRSELNDYRDWIRSAVRPDDEKALAEELTELVKDEAATARILIVIEDMTHLVDGPADRPMRALLQAVNDSEHMLVGEADVTRAGGNVGVLGEWKSLRQGIALKPDTYDGDSIFKASFGRVKRSDFPIGRGFFVQGGRVMLTQTPLVTRDGRPARPAPVPGNGARADESAPAAPVG